MVGERGRRGQEEEGMEGAEGRCVRAEMAGRVSEDGEENLPYLHPLNLKRMHCA